jgi:hypothetical protein
MTLLPQDPAFVVGERGFDDEEGMPRGIGPRSKAVISDHRTDLNFATLEGAIEILQDFGTGSLSSFNTTPSDSIDAPDAGATAAKHQAYFARTPFEAVTGMTVFPTGGTLSPPTNAILAGQPLGKACP